MRNLPFFSKLGSVFIEIGDVTDVHCGAMTWLLSSGKQIVSHLVCNLKQLQLSTSPEQAPGLSIVEMYL